jgi:hypothetical protein
VQSNAQSVDTAGITNAAVNDFTSNGQGSSLTVNSAVACSCDSGGSLSPSPATSYCTPPPNGANTTAGSCPGGGHWVVILTVTASGTFNSLFNYPGIPSSISVSKVSAMRVNING